MTRSMQKAIDDYRALCDRKGGAFGSFYTDDVNQLRQIAEDKGGINFRKIELHAIVSGLEAGFMIGYKAAKREARKKLQG